MNTLMCHNPVYSGAVSEESQKSNDIYMQTREERLLTATYFMPYLRLKSVYDECKDSDWDGYGALAISEVAYENACRFLMNLPQRYLTSDISPEADGYISFEWYNNPNCIVSVSINDDGYIHFAALIYNIRRNGSEPLSEMISGDLIQLIDKVIN